MSIHIQGQKWIGKALGFALAMIWAPTDPVLLPLLVIAGICVGHIYDWWAMGQAAERLQGLSSNTLNALSLKQEDTQLLLQFTFGASGRIAKAGGLVSQAHISCAERLMEAVDLDPTDRRHAINWFEEGKHGRMDFAGLARSLRNLGAKPRDLLMATLCHFATINPNRSTVFELKQIGGLLGASTAQLNQMFARVKSSSSPGAAPAEPGLPTHISAAMKSLELPEDAPLTDAQHAYRRLVSRYHPDRLGPGASQQEIQHAQAKMVELREALDTLKHFAANPPADNSPT